MSIIYHLDALCLRYIVPFKFKESFDIAVNKVEDCKTDSGRKIWERKYTVSDDPNSDLYRYVKNEFRFDDESGKPSDRKFGCEWQYGSYDNDGKAHSLKDLLYYPHSIQANREENAGACRTASSGGWKITVSDMSLILFRNGLGLIWYELQMPQKNINSEELKEFQNHIRILNPLPYFPTKIWEIHDSAPESYLIINEDSEIEKYITPFSFGNWIAGLLDFLKADYFAERQNNFTDMAAKSMADARESGLKGHFPDESYRETYRYVPIKSILFNYISFSPTGLTDASKNRCSLLFWLTNGYQDSYHVSEEVEQEIKRPFDDVYWFATKEGASIMAWPEADNRKAFSNYLPAKARIDYFTLYIKALYQSYSLLIYAEKIQEEISAVYNKEQVDLSDPKVMELFGEINQFLAKSMATSVSHVHHQSEFYIYLKNQLHIHDDVKSVTAGLNALNEIQRKKLEHEEQKENREREQREKESDDKLQKTMGWLSILGISSGLVDCFDFIGKFNPITGDFWGFSIILKAIEILFFCIYGYIIIRVFMGIHENSKKKDSFIHRILSIRKKRMK